MNDTISSPERAESETVPSPVIVQIVTDDDRRFAAMVAVAEAIGGVEVYRWRDRVPRKLVVGVEDATWDRTAGPTAASAVQGPPKRRLPAAP